ncbi:MAG: hypothetical protein DRJ96_08375 [Thermoprotei archaeon]|nr:MAG: hypothetical protein DRJ67_09530 [Thermoprotei archaeon]RLE95575.1 MAG: hypothetical protein DRJ96_08375 [Thermoprotei archaeon]
MSAQLLLLEEEARAEAPSRTVIVSFHMPRGLLRALDKLVEMGVFNNRSEAMRTAVYRLICEYSEKLKPLLAPQQAGYR